MDTAHSRHQASALLMVLFAAAVALLVSGCSGAAGQSGNAGAEDGAAASYTTVTPGKLTVVSDLANPPFDYMTDGKAAGFEVDLLHLLAGKLGLECEYLPAQKFDSIIPMIKQGGKADVGASNFTITDERKQEIDFTDAFIDSNQGIVTPAAQAEAVTADVMTLNNPSTTVAVQAGTTGESWAKENLPSAQVVPLDDPVAALTGVQTGLYSAAIADLPVMQYECLYSFTDLRVAGEIATGEQYGIVVSKDNPALTAALNDALAEARADGSLTTLEEKWFGSAATVSDTPAAAAAATDATAGEKDAATADAATPAAAGDAAVTVNKATARPNEDGGSDVIGGMNTRLTWEATVDGADGLKEVTLSLPEDATFEGSSTRITVLDGLNRISITGDAVPSGNSITVTFDTVIPQGSLLRLEITNMQFPSEGGDYAVSGSFVSESGATGQLQDSAPIAIIANTPVQKIVSWLDGQGWVSAWNSVPFLNMFFKPQLLVTSFVSLSGGWLVCLAIVIASYPFAILLGLLFAIMKISQVTFARGVASVYINIIRGTPLFLQIYIMFFGLPMMGINIDNNVLGVMVMAINSSAYLAEIFRAGIQSIPQGQYEAASSLGMNRAQTMISIILPQTIRRVIPTVTSDFITNYKDTSLLSSVGVMELMMFSKNLTTVTGNITPYMAAAIYYLIVTLPLIKVVGIVEKRLANAERGGGPRPNAKAGAVDKSATTGTASPRSAASSYHAEATDRDAASGMIDALTGPFRSHPVQEV